MATFTVTRAADVVASDDAQRLLHSSGSRTDLVLQDLTLANGQAGGGANGGASSSAAAASP